MYERSQRLLPNQRKLGHSGVSRKVALKELRVEPIP